MSAPAEPGWLLLVQAGATLYLTGLIWFVQIVHYPLFDRVGAEGFARYHEAHRRRTGWVVGPPMLLEAATALAAALRPPDGVPGWQAWLGLALLAGIWISTAMLQVPQHARLRRGFTQAAHRRLVATDWIRVFGWSTRAVLVLVWLR